MCKMEPIMGIVIAGTGHFLPDRILTNQDLEKMVDTSDEWIVTRTGIRERHIAEPETATSDLAVGAGRNALENAGLSPEDLDLIVVSSITPDQPTPSTATIVQNKLGAAATKCMCFDVSAACAGLLYGLNLAHALLASGERKTALVIGADKLSCVTNWKDRSTCVLFGDAASALIVRVDPAADFDCLVGSEIGADGRFGDILQIPGFGSACPATPESLAACRNSVVMNGPKTFQQAVLAMTTACRNVLDKTGVKPEQIRWVIPHQANDRIISSVAEHLNMPDRVYRNVERCGNTSSASIGICLDELNRSGRLNRGDYVLAASFGAGLTWAAEVIRW